MKKKNVLFAVPIFLCLSATLDASGNFHDSNNRDKEKPNSHAGKRASVKTTRVRNKFSIQNRLRPTKSKARGGFYSFKHHDYSFHIFKHKVVKTKASKKTISE